VIAFVFDNGTDARGMFGGVYHQSGLGLGSAEAGFGHGFVPPDGLQLLP
jgi:hypothetical protein